MPDDKINLHLIKKWFGNYPFSKDVINAMSVIPRHKFVPAHLTKKAYENFPLPIGFGQTISQPYMVALMTDLLLVRAHNKILEVGTGSGYQAAILATLGARVFSIERILKLNQKSLKTFSDLNIKGIQTCIGNGYFGWASEAPFDRIMVTAAAPIIPPELIRQLKTGGRLIIPIGQKTNNQVLTIVDKKLDGTIIKEEHTSVSFVPLIK